MGAHYILYYVKTQEFPKQYQMFLIKDRFKRNNTP